MKPQVSPTLRRLALEIEAESRIPVDQSDNPNFFAYNYQTGEPLIPDRSS
jgi:hypothetical protein